MSIIIIAPTRQGYQLAYSLQTVLNPVEIWTKHPVSEQKTSLGIAVNVYTSSISDILDHCWHHCDQLVFILTTGAVVRLIGPLLQDKATDPGVITLDEAGQFVISLCGGHQGGADQLTRQIATALNLTPVITSASTQQQYPALDQLGLPYGWQRGPGQTLAVMTALIQGDPISTVQTCGLEIWQASLPPDHPVQFESPVQFAAQKPDTYPLLWISDQCPPAGQTPKICWHPRTLWIGLGCERGTPTAVMEEAVQQALSHENLAFESIAGLASIDLKQDEIGLLQLAQHYQWPQQWFTAAELADQEVPHPSEVVARAVGTPSVAEAAALRAAKSSDLVVAKQIVQTQAGACTVAIARSTQEYNPRLGQIWLVGIGPGDLAQLTAAARVALVKADVVIGYKLYVEFIRPLLHPDQVIETSFITQEVQRAERAITLAQRGLTIAVVSSGDSGIYGMAGLVLERLAQQHWDGQHPAIEVFPGITALQATAARVGSPLMHDFCAISLSDLLTPWPVIEKRLRAAAEADFVVALYNPRSQQRTQGILKAKDIFLHYRSGQTPVLIAQSVYRPQEQVYQTTLEALDVTQIDMLTLVMIGNASTFAYHQFLITPRGYFPS